MTTRRNLFGKLLGAVLVAPVAAKAAKVIANAPPVPLAVPNVCLQIVHDTIAWVDNFASCQSFIPRACGNPLPCATHANGGYTCAAVSQSYGACIKGGPHDGPHFDGRDWFILS